MTATRKVMAGQPGRRWGLLNGIDIGADGDPYLDRLRILETPWFAVFLHHIHRPDRDPDPHDHPWAFWSLVLTGSYREQVWPDKRLAGTGTGAYRVRSRGRGSLRRLDRGAAHIIKDIDGPLWTLVITGRRRDDWGFWVHGEFVPWREYISGNGTENYAAARDAEDGPPRDEAYWSEIERAVGRGTPAVLLGTSTRALRRSLARMRRGEP